LQGQGAQAEQEAAAAAAAKRLVGWPRLTAGISSRRAGPLLGRKKDINRKRTK
jgi:hypothetical protein